MAHSVAITGANRGIGLALARRYLDAGWTVLATCRRPREATNLIELHARCPDRLHVLSLDVNDEGSVAAAARATGEIVDGIDVLINNAAVGSHETAYSLETLDFHRTLAVFRTNSLGPLGVMRAFRPLLRKGESPRVINISSGAGRISSKQDHEMYDYGASKAALNFLTRAAADELRDDGITVVAFSPGWVRTDMGGGGAPLSPEESAEGIFRTVKGLGLDDTSEWFNQEGWRSKSW